MKRILPPVIFVFLSLVLAGCGSPRTAPAAGGQTQGSVLTVMAAASLTEPFTEMGELFESIHPGVRVQFNFAASQQLAQQLEQGAQADVFASANLAQMESAVRSGRVAEGAPRIFAHNQLVVIYPIDNPAGLKNLEDLNSPGLKLVLAAREVPVGKYSLEFLEKASQPEFFGSGYREAVLANVVSYENNVKSVLVKVRLGEADAGIVYTSDTVGEPAEDVGRLDIPDELNLIADYPIAIVADSRSPVQAQQFLDLVFSGEGQAVLEKHGFMRIDE